ncbi:MAG: hypothetical protein QOG21_1199 [Actinomycetota bacterium]|jgi:hypothetical protein|nr:hypothetical protein [Actinomycetota bacterium]
MADAINFSWKKVMEKWWSWRWSSVWVWGQG